MKKNKRGEFGLQKAILVGVLMIVCFSALFGLLSSEISNSAYPLDSEMQEGYTKIDGDLNDINNTVMEIKDSTLLLAESSTAGSGSAIITTVQGVSKVGKLFKESLTFIWDIISVMAGFLRIPLPDWAMPALYLGLIVIIIVLIIKFITGRSNYQGM